MPRTQVHPRFQVFLMDVVARTLKVCTGHWCHAQPATLATRFHFAPLRPRLLLTAAPATTMTEGLRGNSAPRHRRMYGKFLAFRSDGTPRRRPHNRSRRPQLRIHLARRAHRASFVLLFTDICGTPWPSSRLAEQPLYRDRFSPHIPPCCDNEEKTLSFPLAPRAVAGLRFPLHFACIPS